MTSASAALPPVWNHVGLILSLLLSLAIFSFVLRESVLVRLAQYLLVGVSLGYVVVLVWHSILWPRLFHPLVSEPLLRRQPGMPPVTEAIWLYWVPLGLGMLLCLAGVGALYSGSNGASSRLGPITRLLALLPLGIFAGAGIGVGIAGAIQGTLLPQFVRAAQIGLPLDASLDRIVAGLLTLIVTGGVLVSLQTALHATPKLPFFLRPLMTGWIWVGRRALWLAAGFLFARLFASRITLLVARLHYFLFEVLENSWLRSIWERGLL